VQGKHFKKQQKLVFPSSAQRILGIQAKKQAFLLKGGACFSMLEEQLFSILL
jgi:hypothetical protein